MRITSDTVIELGMQVVALFVLGTALLIGSGSMSYALSYMVPIALASVVMNVFAYEMHTTFWNSLKGKNK